MPADAEAPSDLVTPLTARPAASARSARSSSAATGGSSGSSRSRSGNDFASKARIGEAGELVLGRDLRHRDRALGERRDVARDVVGRHDRGAAADEDAQTDVVAFGALGFLDRAFAHADRKRHRAHRDRVGGIGAGAARRGDQTFGEIGQSGLVEK